jgi:hypothetical protein
MKGNLNSHRYVIPVLLVVVGLPSLIRKVKNSVSKSIFDLESKIL